jgi:subtilisin family serine protease
MLQPSGIHDPALAEELRAGDGDDELSVIVRLSDPDALPPGVRVVTRFGDIATVRVDRDQAQELAESATITALEKSRNLRPSYEMGGDWENEEALEDNVGEDEPAEPAGYTRRPEGLQCTGTGVVVAALDWGVDPCHPAFQHADGSTRILSLWDQRSTEGGGAGNRWGYGYIHTEEDINRALKSDDPYGALNYHPADAGGAGSAHGTHVLDIAAGSGLGGGMAGVAPEADLVFVHLARTTEILSEGSLGDSASVLEALEQVFSVAGDRPCVVNMSVGAHGGSHDGETLVELGIDRAVSLVPTASRAVTNSSGNYRLRRAHSSGRVSPDAPKIIPFRVPPNDPNDSELELFYSRVDRFVVEVVGPEGNLVARAGPGQDSPMIDGTTLVGHLYHRVRYGTTGDHHVDLLLKPGAPGGIWQLRLIGQDVYDGRYHAWIERDRGLQPTFLDADVVKTATTGTLCNARLSITCGCVNAYIEPPTLVGFSSGGPTRDGRVKPELVAPGYRIRAARSTPRGAAPGARYTRKSGTSMAAPHVAGTIALMFEAAGRPLEIYDTRALLFGSVDPSPFFDRPIPGPDLHRFGYGMLDIVAAERAAREFGREHDPGSEIELETMAAVVSVDSEAEEEQEEEEEEKQLEEEIEVSEVTALDEPSPETMEPWQEGGDVTDTTRRSEILRGELSKIPWIQNPGDLQQLALQSLGIEEDQPLVALTNVAGGLLTAVEPGDLLVRSAPVAGGQYTAVVVAEPEPARSMLGRGVPVESEGSGWFVQVVEVPFGGGAPRTIGRRLTDGSGQVPRYQQVFRAPGLTEPSAAFDQGEQSSTGLAEWRPYPTTPVLNESAILTWKNLTRIPDSRGGLQVFVVVTGAPPRNFVPGHPATALFYLEVQNTNGTINHENVVTKHRFLQVDAQAVPHEVHSWIKRGEPDLEDETSHVLRPIPLPMDTLKYAYQMAQDGPTSAHSPKARIEVEYHWREFGAYYNRAGLDFMLVAPIEYLFSSKKLLTPKDITLDDVKYRNDFWIHIDTVGFTPEMKDPVTYDLQVSTTLQRQASEETTTERRTAKTKEKTQQTATGFKVEIKPELSRGGSAKVGIDVLELGVEQMVKVGVDLGYSRTTTDTMTESLIKEITHSLRLTQAYSVSEGVSLNTHFTVSPTKALAPGRARPKAGISSKPSKQTVGVYLIPVIGFYEVPYVRFSEVNKYGQATKRTEGTAVIPVLRRWVRTTYVEED